jgi:LacI family transcriptional regulator
VSKEIERRSLYPLLANFRIPHVLTWSLDASGHHDCVGFDNRAAAARVARHLVDLGHRHMAVVTGFTAHNDRARDRIAGVRDVLAAHGIELAPDRVLEFAFAVRSGRDALQRAMRLVPRPTALICGNDVLAQGALIEAHALGIDVPRLLSITGFDDMELAAQTPPGLTTIRIPTAEIGRRVARHLLARIDGAEAERCTELEVELVVRGSTAPPART